MHTLSLPVLTSTAAPAPNPLGLETGPRSISAVKMLRVSLTDRCNFRCVYCMPAEGVPWLPADQLLSFDQIVDVIRAAVEIHGITSIKLTGGEPTLRPQLPELVRRIRAISSTLDLSLTTNGSRLASLARPLKESGLDRITISLDTLQADRFFRITRNGHLDEVWRGIDACLAHGLAPVKLNVVAMRGFNDDELADFARLTLRLPITVRFIEYMPLGDAAVLAGGLIFDAQDSAQGQRTYAPRIAAPQVAAPTIATQPQPISPKSMLPYHYLDRWLGMPDEPALDPLPVLSAPSSALSIANEEIGPAGGCGAQDRGNVFISQGQMQSVIESELGPLVSIDRTTEAGLGPAQVFQLNRPDALGRIGFISAMSHPFCSTCNRLRLTATGILRSCLFDGGEVDLAPILAGIPPADRPQAIADAMQRCVALKPAVHSARGDTPMSRIGG